MWSRTLGAEKMVIINPEQYQGKIIKVYFLDGTEPVTGEYGGYTSEYDDPDGRENIGVNPVGVKSWGYDLYGDEIERIEIVQDT